MLSLPSSVRIFVATDPVDFRKAFDGLCAVVRDVLSDDPFGGHLFVFFNRRHDRIKILTWDRNGFWLFYKRLEQGTFEVQSLLDNAVNRKEVSRAHLHMLLEGIDIRKTKFRKHFAREIRIEKRADDQHGRHQATLPG